MQQGGWVSNEVPPAQAPAPAGDEGRATTSVLVVLAAPDGRPSTVELGEEVEVLRSMPGVRCEVWCLRDYHGLRWPGARNVDDLRTWWPSRLLASVGLDRVGAALRGRRLRRWQRAVRPDVVILNDGYGARVLDGCSPRPVVVVRRNDDLGDTFGFDEEHLDRGDVTLASIGAPADGDERPWIEIPPHLRLDEHIQELEPAIAHARRARQDGRRELGLEGRVPLVVGWGDDGWVDGSTAFVRTLWFLEHRHGVVAHGAWFAPMADQVEVDRLRSEAERCGVADRLVLLPPSPTLQQWCGDVAVLPWRVPPGGDVAAVAGACRVPLVAFEPLPLVAPWCLGAPVLDVPALAAAAWAALEGHFEQPPDAWHVASRREVLEDVLAAAHQARR